MNECAVQSLKLVRALGDMELTSGHTSLLVRLGSLCVTWRPQKRPRQLTLIKYPFLHPPHLPSFNTSCLWSLIQWKILVAGTILFFKAMFMVFCSLVCARHSWLMHEDLIPGSQLAVSATKIMACKSANSLRRHKKSGRRCNRLLYWEKAEAWGLCFELSLFMIECRAHAQSPLSDENNHLEVWAQLAWLLSDQPCSEVSAMCGRI